jgi:alkanesulfonate monooxygenase SsuD/methylene tetrahydromethanopterin reductase-like flavin-dependent oxidoreductase (luciferase family)
MLRLVARYGDGWNWWGWDETIDDIISRMNPLVAELERACVEVGRDSTEIERTFDLYSVVPPGFSPDASEMSQPVSGSADEIADTLLSLGALGIDEVRCDLTDKTDAGIEAMAPVVEALHNA